MSKVVKVLHMAPLGSGGISKLTVTINGLIDLRKVKFDYLVFKDEKTFYEDIVYKYAAEKKLVDVSKYKNKLLLYWKKYQLTYKMLLKNKYDVVHVDASTPMDVVIGMAAKKAGVNYVIIHSHIAGDNKHSWFRSFYFDVCRRKMIGVFDDYIAISDSAAEFMFPTSIVQEKKYRIVSNGIVADEYHYDKTVRQEWRKRLNVESNFLVGHVGRFSKEKNHKFIIEVFSKLIQIVPSAKLLLIGEGGLKPEIEKLVIDKGLSDKVIFYGISHEIPKLMLAMDAFIFPSHYEGLGIAAVEAQCSGLPLFCSKGIPEATRLTPVFNYVDGADPENWAQAIASSQGAERKDYVNEVKNAGFDIIHIAKEMEEYYIEKAEK